MSRRSMTLSTKFYHVAQTALQIRSCGRSVNSSISIFSLMRIWLEEQIFLKAGLGSSSVIETGTTYGIEKLQQCDKKVKAKSHKAWGLTPWLQGKI